VAVALLGFLGLLGLLVVGAVMALGDAEADRDDVPEGIADVAIETIRTEDVLTVVVPGNQGESTLVSVCPGLLPGPSDAAGMLERIRVSGCVAVTPDPSAADDTWTLPFSVLDPDAVVALDAAERWLVVVVDPSVDGDDASGVAGAWIAGGPLLPTGPVLP
jgi:hypothetical protein